MNLRPLLSLPVLLFSTPASATDYFVSPLGDGSNSGQSCAEPGSVFDAFEAVGPGDRILYCDGVYGSIKLTTSGTAEAPLVIQAAPGTVPIIRGTEDSADLVDGIYSDGPVSHIVIDGFWIDNWENSGVGLDYLACSDDDPSAAVSNITIKNCVVDSNGRSGISAYMGSGYTIENNIVSRNGNGPESWSSNVNLYGVRGTDNVVRGNISFHAVDVSSNNTDGNGYILDLSLDEGSALFEDNIGFLNGGACVASTDSSGARIQYNSCYKNAQRTVDEFSFVDTCRNQVACIDVAGQPFSFSGYQFVNNLSVADATLGRTGTYALSCGSPATLTGMGNVLSATEEGQFADPASADFTTNLSVGSRLSYDPACIKQQAGELPFWSHAPDLDYVARIGGIQNCFSPGQVTCKEAESPCETTCRNLNVDAQNCGECGNVCPQGQRCESGSCQSGPGDFAVDPYGYVTSCSWAGYSWTAAGPEEPGLSATTSTIEAAAPLCALGTVAAYEDYGGYAILGINLAQETGTNTPANDIVPQGDGLVVRVDSNGSAAVLRVQLQDSAGSGRWCVELEGDGGYYPWGEFNTACWDGSGTAYAGEPINVIAIQAAGGNEEDLAFDFCLEGFSPSGVDCSTGTPGTGGTTGTGGVGTGATDSGGCATSLVDCEGTCTDPFTDVNHCGACGTSCDPGHSCQSGTCAAGPAGDDASESGGCSSYGADTRRSRLPWVLLLALLALLSRARKLYLPGRGRNIL